MSEWQEYTLREVVDKFIDYRGKTPSKSESGIPLITAKIIKNGTIETPAEFISEELYEIHMRRGLPRINDVLLTVEAPLGEVALVKNERIALAQRIITLRGKKDKLDNVFLKYCLQGHVMQHRLRGRATGTTVQGIKSAELKKIRIDLPPLLEQRRIAAVLSTLDAKIDLLRRQNATLEAIAQALFKRWFIDFEFPDAHGRPYRSAGGRMQPSELGEIPHGWRVGTLGEEFDILMGQSPSGESYNEEGKGMVFFQGRTDFGFRFPTIRLYTTEPKRIANRFDVLVSVRAPVGDVNVAFERCCVGRGLAAVKNSSTSYCLYKIRSYRKRFGVFEAEGTVFGSLNKDDFNNLLNIIPTAQIVLEFERITSPLDLKVYNNEHQIRTLTRLRDTLLPKLMSGQLRVQP